MTSVELLVGRRLTAAEEAIDVVKLDQALEHAKDAVEQAIRDEMLLATRAWVNGYPAVVLHVTAGMLQPLQELYDLGVEEARAELDRAGYQVGRAFDAANPEPGASLEDLAATIGQGLPGISVRVEDELVAADLSLLSSDAIATALLEIPGARDIASRVISTAMYAGFGATFETHAHLVDETADGDGDGWAYSSILDAATCPPCARLDGTTYPTWEAIQTVLPQGGPHPGCRGGGRCRCRAVPRPRRQ